MLQPTEPNWPGPLFFIFIVLSSICHSIFVCLFVVFLSHWTTNRKRIESWSLSFTVTYKEAAASTKTKAFLGSPGQQNSGGDRVAPC